MNSTEETSSSTEGPSSAAMGAAFAAQAVDSIDAVVGVVHDKAIRPVVLIARGIVFGTIIALALTVVAFMAVIALFRIFDVYVFAGRNWATYLLFGALFLAGGATLWTRTSPRTRE